MLNVQRGFSLLEVLVALVVLSIGLMGIASMQVVGLQFNQQALTSTRAIELAADMADRIRANVGGETIAGLRNAYETDFGNPVAGTSCADAPGNDVTIVSCTKQQLAAFDIWQWKTALQPGSGSGLADGDGAITHAFDNGVSTYTIDVRWSERGEQTHYVLEVLL